MEASCQRCALKMRILHVAKFKMEVRISGCVFASLFIELANSKGDIVSASFLSKWRELPQMLYLECIFLSKEGFLIGEISDRTTNTVSDSQDVTVKRQRIFGKAFVR